MEDPGGADETRRLRRELNAARAALEWVVGHLEERAASSAVAAHDEFKPSWNIVGVNSRVAAI